MRLRDILEDIGSHYSTLDADEKHGDEYYGRNVVWYGERGRMLKLTKENSEPIWGNTFDYDKIEETADAIKYAEDRVKFYAPLCDAVILDIQDIKENIEGKRHGDLMHDPVIDDVHTFSTGDSDLDEYIVDPEEYLDDNSYEDEDRKELKQEMEDLKEQAIKEQWGNIGELFIQVRDGNHRRAAAFASGESVVWGILMKDSDGKAELKKHLE